MVFTRIYRGSLENPRVKIAVGQDLHVFEGDVFAHVINNHAGSRLPLCHECRPGGPSLCFSWCAANTRTSLAHNGR